MTPPQHPIESEGERGEVRLVAVRFVPDQNGGRWEPVGRSTLSSFQWIDAWEDGITEQEAKALGLAAIFGAPDSASTKISNPEHAHASQTLESAKAKLRAAFAPDPQPPTESEEDR